MGTSPKIKSSMVGFYVIGIGASAGGLEAINDLFDNVPADTGFAFVLVQHLSHDHKSLMGELLARHTTMPIQEAQDGLRVAPNHVYLLPGRQQLTISGGCLRLNPDPPSQAPNTAIDHFFESLAADQRGHAVGIILSGTGSDGTRGLEAIRRAGGVAVVQDPLTAAFDGMPNSAIASGAADLITSPDKMTSELIEFLKEADLLGDFRLNGFRDGKLLSEVLMTVRNETGRDFSHYKRSTLIRRLSKRLLELNLSSLKDYLDHLHIHPAEVRRMAQDFLINVTSFFRDTAAFEVLSQTVIPSIFQDKHPGDVVKVWSVACSTGEEAYSLAILFHEHMERNKLYDVTLKLFATDIDREALARASAGIYTADAVNVLGKERVQRYFIREGEGFRIRPEIRKLIVFSCHDVLKDPPFSRIDLALCRNMLIYMGTGAQREVLRKLHFGLNVPGYLVLGSSEHPGPLAPFLQDVDKKWRVYKNVAKQKTMENDPLWSPLDRHTQTTDAGRKQKDPVGHIPELFSETLLEQYPFAGILIDTNFEVKQATGAFKQYIDLPESGFHFNLMKLVPQDLGIALNVAVRKAIRDNETVTAKKVKVSKGESVRLVNVVVKPYLQRGAYSEKFLFIILSEASAKKQDDHSSPPGSQADRKIKSLESELKATRENLQSVIEEIEAANEELQSNNEEMVSTNEELQSANEELQSLNEELHTMSAEHQQKIRELIALNDDLSNFFKNTPVGKILVDSHLVIRRLSPPVKKVIHVIESDVNRSITDFSNSLNGVDLVEDIRRVIRSGERYEKTVSAGKLYFLMRIDPYVRQDGSDDGVIVSFVDVTELRKLNGMLKAILDSSPGSICALRAVRDEAGAVSDFEFIESNRTHARLLDLPEGAVIGRRLSEVGEEDLIGHYTKVLGSGGPVHYEKFDEKQGRWYDVVLVKLMDGLVVTSTDVTDRKRAADMVARSFEDLKKTSKKLRTMNLRLEQSNMDLLQFASVASHDLKEPLRKIQTFGNLLASKSLDKLDEQEKKYLGKIVSASARMQRLIEDVLTLSKLSNRDQELEAVDLDKVVQMIRDDLEITVREKNATIKVDALPVVQGIGGQIHQVFQNLISNALKFTAGRAPVIEITYSFVSRADSKKRQMRPGNYHCISVRDNGIGFEPAYKDKIFGIFQRLNGSEYDGTGIGLSICKKIMENHNGYIFADSVPGKGSEFSILLPADPVPASRDVQEAVQAQRN